MIQKFVWKIKKNVRIHDDDFFSEKMRLFVQKKKNIIAFWMTASLEWVQGEVPTIRGVAFDQWTMPRPLSRSLPRPQQDVCSSYLLAS